MEEDEFLSESDRESLKISEKKIKERYNLLLNLRNKYFAMWEELIQHGNEISGIKMDMIMLFVNDIDKLQNDLYDLEMKGREGKK